jgi:mono/diheme cytochrome c family protein
MIGIRTIGLLGALGVAAIATGCAPAAEPATAAPAAVTVTPEMIAQGRTLFTGQGRCGVCHGPAGRGGSLGPNLTDAQWIWVDPAGNVHNQLFRIIKDGIDEPRQFPAPMPAMGGGNLSDEQIHALAAYVDSLTPNS